MLAAHLLDHLLALLIGVTCGLFLFATFINVRARWWLQNYQIGYPRYNEVCMFYRKWMKIFFVFLILTLIVGYFVR